MTGSDDRWPQRRSGFGGGGWVRLLGDLPGQQVLLAEWPPSRATERLEAAGAEVTPVGDRWPEGAAWDLVCLDLAVGHGPVLAGRVLDGDLVAEAARRVRPGGQLVMIAAHRGNPLHLLDRAGGRAVGTSAVTWRGLQRWLARVDMAPSRRFGLLRTAAAPVAAFDLDAPRATAALVGATASHVSGARAVALRLLLLAARRPALLAAATPGLAVVARHRSALPSTPPDAFPVTAVIGNNDSDEGKIVRGEPPRALEKDYPRAECAAAEIEALAALAAAGVEAVPRFIARTADTRVCTSWLPGAALRVDRLSASELLHWTLAAARMLLGVQRRTKRPDGSVLVHGDYWLGNLLVDEQRAAIVGIVDWTEARWGSHEVDRAFLLTTVERCSHLPQMARDAAVLTGRAVFDVTDERATA